MAELKEPAGRATEVGGPDRAGGRDAAESFQAIEEVMLGRRHVTPPAARGLVDAFLHAPAAGSKAAELSPRQREVLQLLAEGRTMKEIARVPERVRGPDPRRSEQDRLPTGSLGGGAALKQAPPSTIPPDTWFTLEVIPRDNHLEIRVNDQTAVDVRDNGNTYRGGRFALQSGGLGGPPRFRFAGSRSRNCLPNSPCLRGSGSSGVAARASFENAPRAPVPAASG